MMACFGGPTIEQEQRERDDLATIVQLACMYCTEQEAHGWKVPEFARSWWDRHKKDDNERQERDRQERRKRELASKALGKLSTEEREALGIH